MNKRYEELLHAMDKPYYDEPSYNERADPPSFADQEEPSGGGPSTMDKHIAPDTDDESYLVPCLTNLHAFTSLKAPYCNCGRVARLA